MGRGVGKPNSSSQISGRRGRSMGFSQPKKLFLSPPPATSSHTRNRRVEDPHTITLPDFEEDSQDVGGDEMFGSQSQRVSTDTDGGFFDIHTRYEPPKDLVQERDPGHDKPHGQEESSKSAFEGGQQKPEGKTVMVDHARIIMLEKLLEAEKRKRIEAEQEVEQNKKQAEKAFKAAKVRDQVLCSFEKEISGAVETQDFMVTVNQQEAIQLETNGRRLLNLLVEAQPDFKPENLATMNLADLPQNWYATVQGYFRQRFPVLETEEKPQLLNYFFWAGVRAKLEDWLKNKRQLGKGRKRKKVDSESTTSSPGTPDSRTSSEKSSS